MRWWLTALLTLAYPVCVYWALGRFEPRTIAWVLAIFAAIRAFTTREPVWLAALLGTLLLASTSFLGNAALPLKLYPVLMNGVQLAIFATSLVHPPTVVERLARLRHPALPASAVAYTRKVTWVWCAFFVVNGSIALATSMWASNHVWALYNGLIAYGLMGVLFAGEYLVRLRVQARAADRGAL